MSKITADFDLDLPVGIVASIGGFLVQMNEDGTMSISTKRGNTELDKPLIIKAGFIGKKPEVVREINTEPSLCSEVMAPTGKETESTKCSLSNPIFAFTETYFEKSDNRMGLLCDQWGALANEVETKDVNKKRLVETVKELFKTIPPESVTEISTEGFDSPNSDFSITLHFSIK